MWEVLPETFLVEHKDVYLIKKTRVKLIKAKGSRTALPPRKASSVHWGNPKTWPKQKLIVSSSFLKGCRCSHNMTSIVSLLDVNQLGLVQS